MKNRIKKFGSFVKKLRCEINNLNKAYKNSNHIINVKSRALPVNFSDIKDYLLGIRTPSRILCDYAVKELMPLLKGTVVEIGADRTQEYKRFALSAKEYILSNVIHDSNEMIYLDAMNMHFDDNSIDSFVCLSVLEHINDPWKVISEVYRVLKPGGRLLLIVPFVFPFHSAPDDFYRFSHSAILDMLKGFRIIEFEALGNYWSTIAFIFQRPKWRTWPGTVGWWPWDIFLRFVGLIFYLISRFKVTPDDYAMLYCVLAEKTK